MTLSASDDHHIRNLRFGVMPASNAPKTLELISDCKKRMDAVWQKPGFELIWFATSRDCHIIFGKIYYSKDIFVRFFKIKKVNEKKCYSCKKNVRRFYSCANTSLKK
jgi:hypothetical protein